MTSRDIVAIGTSAGGVEALRFLVSKLAADFPASVVVTIHLSSQFGSALDAILSRAGPLQVSFAKDGQHLEKARVYLAPPNRHLLIDGERLWLGVGPRENHARPAIDPMFRSIAACCGARAIGVILTGTLGDGASGLFALEQCGAITVIQDPSEAIYSEMPATALRQSRSAHLLPLSEIPALLNELIRTPAGKPTPVPEHINYEVQIAKTGRASMNDLDRIGQRSVLTCPDCNGVLWEIKEGALVRYRCHVGHSYTAGLMNVALEESLRFALATALRALEERTALAQRLRDEALGSGRTVLAKSWAQQADEFRQQAEIIRDSIRRIDAIPEKISEQPEPRAKRLASSTGRRS